MTDKINCNDRTQRTGKVSAGKHLGTTDFRSADAARFLYKAQCYDAGRKSETKCGLCGEQIQLCYVLKVLHSTDPLSAEIGKLTIGECCFKPIKGVNEKLYRQLLAAAINLRTFMEAIKRDQQLFSGAVLDPGCPPLPLDDDELMASQVFERIIAQGGDRV